MTGPNQTDTSTFRLPRPGGPIMAVVTTRRVGFAGAVDRYDVVLVLLVALLILAPFEGTVLRPLVSALFGFAFLFALWTAQAPRAILVVSAIAVVAILVATSVTQITGGDARRAVFSAGAVLMCVATIASIVARLTSMVTKTARTLAASLAVYLLIGFAFSYTFSLIGAVRSGGFFAEAGPHDAVSYLYFSFTTLTTVGFGDLTAAGDGGRMLAVVEALFGQTYLVTVVAVVVSNRRRA